MRYGEGLEAADIADDNGDSIDGTMVDFIR